MLSTQSLMAGGVQKVPLDQSCVIKKTLLEKHGYEVRLQLL